MPSFTANWSPSSETGTEGHAIALGTISFNKNIASMKSLLVGAIPLGATLSDGHGHSFTATASHSSTDVLAWNLSGLSITPANDANFTLTLTATHSTSGVATASEAVTVNPLAPTVSWSPGSEEGTEGSAIALGTLSAAANGLAGDSNSIASLIVSGIPVDATLSDGHGHTFTATSGHTSTDVLGWTLSNLAITVGSPTTFTLTATATEHDVNGDTSTAAATENVTVNAASPGGYTYITIDDPLGTYGTYVLDINNSAQVAGDYQDDFDLSHGLHGFIYSAGTYHTIAPDGSTASYLFSINNSGEVAGYYNDGSRTHAFLYNGVGYTTLDPTLTTTQSIAYDLNDSGQIVGQYTDITGTHGFIYSAGGYTTLDYPSANFTTAFSINGSGEVSGNYYNGFQAHGFFYDGTGFTPLDGPSAQFTYPSRINDAGEVTGYYYSSGPHAFLYDSSSNTFTTLDFPSASATFGAGINSAGDIAGYTDGSTGRHAFVYDGANFTQLDDPFAINGTAALAINDSGDVGGSYATANTLGFVYDNGVYSDFSYPSSGATSPAAINDSGHIAGSYQNQTGQQHGFLYNGTTFSSFDVPDVLYGFNVLAVNNTDEVLGT